VKSKALVKVMPPQGTKIAAHMREILEMVGEDPSREGLVRTPERYEKALRFMSRDGGWRESLTGPLEQLPEFEQTHDSPRQAA